jgi:hypothetical protein
MERIEARNHVREAQQVAFKLDCAMPRLKGERGTPHAPEICLKERRIKLIGNRASSKELLGFKSQVFDGQNMTLAQTEPGRIDPVSIPKKTGLGRGLHGFVPIKDFPRYRPGTIKGGNRRKEVVGAQIFALDHTASPHHVAVIGISGRIQTAADFG